MFALASSLIVSVFIQKTMPLKTLFYLLVCALKGFDQVQTIEASHSKKCGHKLETQFVSKIIKLERSVLCDILPFSVLLQGFLAIFVIDARWLFTQSHNDKSSSNSEQSECYQMTKRNQNCENKKIN